MKVLMFLLIFLFFGAFFIVSNNNLKLNTRENINLFFSSYFSWFDDLAQNTRTLVGNVIKMDWFPKDFNEHKVV